MNIAIVLAAGKGVRMKNHEIPKAFIDVKGKPLVYYCLATLQECSLIDKIAIVVPNDYFDDAIQYHDTYGFSKIKHVVIGGNTRQQSVCNALHAIKAEENDIVLIHDSARPLVDERIIVDSIKCVKKYGAASTCIPSIDTIITSKSGNKVDSVIERKETYSEQTPASFRYSLILKAHEYALDDKVANASDDVQLVRRLGVDVGMVLGDKKNFKVTTEDDLNYLKAIMIK